MRQIGELADERQARRLGDLLLTRKIKAQIDPAEHGWAIWVYDEDQVQPAREILVRYLQDPDAPEFAGAEREAERLRTEAAAREKQFRKNFVDIRSQWTARNPGSRPLTVLMIALSVAVGFATSFGEDRQQDSVISRLLIANPATLVRSHGEALFGPDAAIRHGEVWRLVTPIFVHSGVVHLLFNMLWLHSLGGAIESRLGTARFALLVLFIAATSNVVQCLWSGPMFGGMSGVVFGLFGYIWISGRFNPAAGMSIDPVTVTMMLFWLILCMSGRIERIANGAHLGGLICGIVAALVPLVWRRLAGR
jgi:GlpG protein